MQKIEYLCLLFIKPYLSWWVFENKQSGRGPKPGGSLQAKYLLIESFGGFRSAKTLRYSESSVLFVTITIVFIEADVVIFELLPIINAKFT